MRLTIQTLDRGWHDRDEILLHAAFQILVDFMDQEKPGKDIDWGHDALHRHAWKEIRSLYRWWTEQRAARHSPLDEKQLVRPPLRFKKIPGTEFSEAVTPDKKKYAAYYRALRQQSRLEDKWEAEDQRNLHRLIEIRGFLWT